MRYLSIYYPSKDAGPPSADHQAKMGKLIEESKKSGELVDTGALLPPSQGARLRRAGNEISVLDGPFAESKEVVAGWAILNAKSKEDAIAMVKRFLQIAGDGDCDLRAIIEADQ